MERSPYYPYPPRPGTQHESANLGVDQQHTLTDQQLDEVIRFEHDLYAADGEAFDSLQTVWTKKVISTDFGVNYFMTEDGRSALDQLVDSDQDQGYESTEECAQILGGLNTSDIDSKTLDKLEADSIGYEERQLSEAFLNGEELPAPNIITVYKNPKTIIEKAVGYRSLKSHLKQVKASLRRAEGPDQMVTEAQLLIVDLYQKKINKLLSATYVQAYKALAQGSFNDEERSQLEYALPSLKQDSTNKRTAQFLEIIDRFDNGVSQDEAGELTWLSPEAQELAKQSEKVGGATDRSTYNDIEPALLENTEIDHETIGELFSDALSSYGMLSESDDWDSERTGAAPDGKWQVIVDDKVKSLSANHKQRVIKVPHKTLSIAAALPRIDHEITHVIQHHNKRTIASLAILDKIGLDKTSEQTEAGAKSQEQKAREMLTGKADTTIAGTGYLKALQVKARGGSYGECVQVYYDDLLEKNPSMKHTKAAAQAVNRARRVFRHGGLQFAQNTPYVTNTQSLSYLEQQLIRNNLSESDSKVLFVGGITAANLGRLARAGLVDLDKIFVPEKMPSVLLHDKIKTLL